MVGAQSLGVSAAKTALRRDVLAARLARTSEHRRAEALAATAALLEKWPPVAGMTIALYDSFGTEPSTESLREAQFAAGATALLPVVLEDHDLSWQTPGGADRGVDAIRECGLVVVPGLAADLRGHRLGRGGGSYDRALRRVAPEVPRVLVLYPDELRAEIPFEPHDELVTHIALPDGVTATSAWLGE